MSNKIVLFLHTKEHKLMDAQPLEHTKHARFRRIGGDDVPLISSTHRWLSDDDKKAKEVIEEFAESQHLELIIYDCAKFWDNMRARFKRITMTPTAILGTHTFTTDITQDRLQKALMAE